MPVKVLPSKEDYDQFAIKLQHEGFRKITYDEFKKNFTRLGLKAPRTKGGRESGFYYSNPNGLTVWVWTTFVERDGFARDEDLGWVLITDGDTRLYFSTPLRRTKGFLEKLFRVALVAKNRVDVRPICPGCGKYLNIEKGRSLGARYWACKNKRAHPGVLHRKSFDFGLTLENLEFVKKERVKRANYRQKRRSEGKVAGHARLIRKPWEMKRPDNRQSMQPVAN